MMAKTAEEPGVKINKTGMTEIGDGNPLKTSTNMAIQVAAYADNTFWIGAATRPGRSRYYVGTANILM